MGLLGKVVKEVGSMLGIIVSLWKMIRAVNEKGNNYLCCPASPDLKKSIYAEPA